MKNFPRGIFYLLHCHCFTGTCILAPQLPTPASLHSSKKFLTHFFLRGRLRDESSSRKPRGSLLWTWLQPPFGRRALLAPAACFPSGPFSSQTHPGGSTPEQKRPHQFKVTKHTPPLLALLLGWFSCVGYPFGFRQVAWSLVPSLFPGTSQQIGPGSLLPALGIGVPSYGCISTFSISPHSVLWEACRCRASCWDLGMG